MSAPGIASIEQEDQLEAVSLLGEWTFENAADIQVVLDQLPPANEPAVEFRCGGLESIDLTGAWLLYNKSRALEAEGKATSFYGFKAAHFKFLEQVTQRESHIRRGGEQHHGENIISHVGRSVVDSVNDVGAMTSMLLRGITRPSKLFVAEVVQQLEDTGLRAIPIMLLLTFLIGVVLAYQAATQLQQFGAAAYTIDLVAISILREMGVILTAIMMAGRSGSAFAASLGVMKLNEETNAMQVMGLDVTSTLVLPRVCALVVALPLLTILADIAGLFGAWLLSVTLLDLSSAQYFARLLEAVDVSTLLVGLSKAPVFAVIIGLVSTYRGLQVQASAEQLGQLTTRAVVESIFLVIAADAVFSIVYSELGW